MREQHTLERVQHRRSRTEAEQLVEAFESSGLVAIPMKPISIPIDRDQCSGLDPISGRSEATLAVAFCGK